MLESLEDQSLTSCMQETKRGNLEIVGTDRLPACVFACLLISLTHKDKPWGLIRF